MRDYRRQMMDRAYFVLHRLIAPAMLPEVSDSFPESNTGAGGPAMDHSPPPHGAKRDGEKYTISTVYLGVGRVALNPSIYGLLYPHMEQRTMTRTDFDL